MNKRSVFGDKMSKIKGGIIAGGSISNKNDWKKEFISSGTSLEVRE